eukprot:UN11740
MLTNIFEFLYAKFFNDINNSVNFFSIFLSLHFIFCVPYEGLKYKETIVNPKNTTLV